MIAHRSAHLLSAGLAMCVALACRDAPTAAGSPGHRPAPPESVTAPVFPGPTIDLVIDTVQELPPMANILNAYTRINFFKSGDRNVGEYSVGMEYRGNRASMKTQYTVSGSASLRDEFFSEHSSVFSLSQIRRFDQVYYIEVPTDCGLSFDGNTLHSAWWFVYFPGVPPDLVQTPKAQLTTVAPPLRLEPCEGEQEPVTTTTISGGTNGGGYITITTCWYWATIVNGRVVAVELDYCESTIIPIDENGAINEM